MMNGLAVRIGECSQRERNIRNSPLCGSSDDRSWALLDGLLILTSKIAFGRFSAPADAISEQNEITNSSNTTDIPFRYLVSRNSPHSSMDGHAASVYITEAPGGGQ